MNDDYYARTKMIIMVPIEIEYHERTNVVFGFKSPTLTDIESVLMKSEGKLPKEHNAEWSDNPIQSEVVILCRPNVGDIVVIADTGSAKVISIADTENSSRIGLRWSNINSWRLSNRVVYYPLLIKGKV